MEVIKQKDRPAKAELVADGFRVGEITFPDGSTGLKLFIHGTIPQLDNQEIEISNTTEGALWLRDGSTEDNLKVGSKQVTNLFFKAFGIKAEKDIAKKKYPLVLQSSKKDPNAQFYVIDPS